MKKSLKIIVKDDIGVTDKLHTYKRWFNGLKFFHTVKVLPKEHKRDRDDS